MNAPNEAQVLVLGQDGRARRLGLGHFGRATLAPANQKIGLGVDRALDQVCCQSAFSQRRLSGVDGGFRAFRGYYVSKKWWRAVLMDNHSVSIWIVPAIILTKWVSC